jgi:hypothetical protein
MFYRNRIKKLEYELNKLRFQIENPCKNKLGLIKSGKHKGTVITSINIVEWNFCAVDFYYEIKGVAPDGTVKRAYQYSNKHILSKLE